MTVKLTECSAPLVGRQEGHYAPTIPVEVHVGVTRPNV